MKPISILGSTGSIGVTALRLIEKHSDRFNVVGLAGGDNIALLAEQVRRFRPKIVAVRTEEGLRALSEATRDLNGVEMGFGTQAMEAVAAHSEAQTVLSAIVGSAGLRPTMAAAKAGKTIGLANKESLVVAGALVTKTVRQHGATLLPVDSEHSAIFQCLTDKSMDQVHRLVLTASGGPFFLKPEVDLSSVTKAQALRHPNWSMGEKITIDSATLMNKGFEAIEACWLFGVGADRIDVVVHPQSIVHSMVEYVDGSIVAQLSVPDMTGPISLALDHPRRIPQAMARLDFAKLREMTFFAPDHARFPSIRHALDAYSAGPLHPAVLNGANEVTVRAFLDERIRLTDVVRINEEVLNGFKGGPASTLEDFIHADRQGREAATARVQEKERSS